MLSPNIIKDIDDERDRQILRYNQAHDDKYSPGNWLRIIWATATNAVTRDGHDLDTFRKQMVRIAAVAIAAIESVDRRK